MEIKAKMFTDGYEDITLYNNLFYFYERVWSDTWKELNISGQHMYDDFCRFDYKIGFFLNNIPVAFHGYKVFDLNKASDRKHSYFSKLPDDVLNHFDKLGLKKIATLEYMSVDRNYRKTAGASVGEILGGFSTQLTAEMPVDVIITVSRNERGVQEMCIKYGAYTLIENLKLNNTEVNVMLFPPDKVRKNSNLEIQNMISALLNDVRTIKPYKMVG